MQKLTYILLVFLILMSCKDAGNKKIDEKTTELYATTSQRSETNPLTESFYKRLEGTIGGKEVVVHISKFKNKIFLNYYYASKGIPIGLYINRDLDPKGDSLELIEYDRFSKNYLQQQDNKWRLVLTANGAKGQWLSGDGKKVYDINLKENYPAGSHLFNVVGTTDSLPIALKSDTVMATSCMMLMEPSDAAASGWYKNALLKSLSGEGNGYSGTIKQYLEEDTKQYLKEYKAELDTMFKNIEISDNDRFSSLNYVNELNSNALYNDHEFLVLDVGSYVYSGGAHGLEGKSIICYDMNQKREMQLNDVISIDSVSLKKIVEKKFRTTSGMKPGQPLTEILFENNLPANDNFYFTNKGLGFIYQPYEVAAYAVGIIYVFIPYTEVKPYLNPQFASRMGIL